MNSLLKTILLFIAGLVSVFAFSPFKLWPLAILCPAVLVYFWRKASPKTAFWLGLSYGFGFFVFGISWVFISMHRFGGVGDITAGFFTGIFALFLALYIGFSGLVLNKCFKGRGLAYLAFAFPAMMTVFELLKSWLFTGFPWLNLGVSQVNSPIGGYAPIFSGFGCSLFTYMCAGLLIYLLTAKGYKKLFGLIGIIIIFAVGYGIKQIHFTHSSGPKRYVSLIQGNIGQSLKWNPGMLTHSMKVYHDQTHDHFSSDFIFWPESAIPMYASRMEPWLNELNLEADKHHTAILLGIPMAKNGKYYNAAIVVGYGHGDYLKRHLVPFGEYIPLQWIAGPIFKIINVPMSDFSEGSAKQTLPVMKGDKVAIFICYESAFAFDVRDQIKNASFGAVLSDDAWFGDSAGPWQHLQIGQMRALETGKYFINDTNTGITAIIAPNGKILKSLTPDKQGALNGTIQAMSGETPWVHYGPWPLTLILIILILLGFMARGKHD